MDCDILEDCPGCSPDGDLKVGCHCDDLEIWGEVSYSFEDSSVVSFTSLAHQGEAEWDLLHIVTALITDEGMEAEELVERLSNDLEGAIQIDGCSLAQEGQLVGSREDKMSPIFVNPNISLEEVLWHVVFGDGELEVGWLRWAVLLQQRMRLAGVGQLPEGISSLRFSAINS